MSRRIRSNNTVGYICTTRYERALGKLIASILFLTLVLMFVSNFFALIPWGYTILIGGAIGLIVALAIDFNTEYKRAKYFASQCGCNFKMVFGLKNWEYQELKFTIKHSQLTLKDLILMEMPK